MQLRDSQDLQFRLAPAAARRAIAASAAGGSTDTVNAVIARLHPNADPALVAEAARRWKHLAALTDQEQSNLLTLSVVNRARVQLGMFTVVLLFVSAVIIALIIYTMTMDKVREIATLKLIGAPDSTIVGLVLQQALLLGWVAYAVVPPDLDGCFVSNEFPTFDWIEGSADPGFIAWIFKQPTIWAEIAKLGVGMGDRRRRVHPESLRTFQVPLPPLDEQRRIVARLDAVSSRLKTRAEAAERQEAELAAMLQQAFARITAGCPRTRMVDVAPLVRRPIEVEPDGQYLELGIRSFGRGPFHKPSLSGLDAGSKRLFRIEPGDLVFNIVFAWEGAVAIARHEDAGRVGSHRFLTCVADQTRVSGEILRAHPGRS
jgi:hypothetical protein